MTLPDLGALLRALDDDRVEFVVIGGIAVGLHGFIRATEDLDIVPDPQPGNLDRLGDLLVRWKATLLLNPAPRFGPRERWALARGRNLSVSTPLGDLDVVQTMPGISPYKELLDRCARFDVDGLELRVASTADLVAMKRARDSELDRADVAALLEGGGP